MNRSNFSHRALTLLSVGVILVAAWALAHFWPSPRGKNAPGPVVGRSIFDARQGREPDAQQLMKLSWADVAATAEDSSVNPSFALKLIAATESSERAPAHYLRGLLLMARSDLEGALAAFDLIPVAEIPAPLLYGPFRLHSTLRPAQANPYLPPLLEAVAAQNVEPLIQARVLAASGRLPAALETYLKTDPGVWQSFDLQILRSFRWHAALANNTAVLIQGALRAGRVPQELRGELVKILALPSDANALSQQRSNLLEQINGDDQLRRAAVTGATRQIAARHSFVNREYRELLEAYRLADPAETPDESILLLTLSAARVSDSSHFHQWSQELKRRYPMAQIERWLEELRNPVP